MTIKFNKFQIHSAFQNGNLNESYFVDLPNLNEEQKKSLSTFLGKLTRSEPLPGKNKPSWLRDDETKIPNTDAYEEGSYWHYHCGPYSDNAHVKSMTFNLSFNAQGLTSNEVIHYQKMEDGTVLVVAFSPTHLPFPPSDEPYDNPLFTD